MTPTTPHAIHHQLKLYYYGVPQLWLTAGMEGTASLIQVVSERIA